jgi:hypothetical protein
MLAISHLPAISTFRGDIHENTQKYGENLKRQLDRSGLRGLEKYKLEILKSDGME